MIGTRLWDYDDTYHRYSVHLHIAFDIGRPQFGAAYVTETDNTVVLFFDDQVIEFFCGVHQPQGTDGELCRISFDTARRKFDIFFVYCILYVDRGDPITRHLDRIEP